MYLKRLDVQGFKSFADKAAMEFNNCINAVVGPNGSGKSNISDAIRWVLGEQSARHLRGTKMEDCIFAGTEHRKPLGFAEVTITLDNTDNFLPFDYSEVTVTRRVYRSGESEYLINKTPCRLKDVNELFFDTGIGKDGYSIIGQGRIDEILSTRSEDRRHIFEEASGIMKYKVRKIEAERKIEQTVQNLLRIRDITSELEVQLGPLKEQSEVARRFLDLRESLKEIEISVFADNLIRYKERLNECTTAMDDLSESLRVQTEKQTAFSEENQSARHKLRELEQMTEEARTLCHEIDNRMERMTSEIVVQKEKIAHSDENVKRLENEIQELQGGFAELSKDRKKREEKEAYLNKQMSIFAERLTTSEKELETLNALLDEGERQIEEMKASVIDRQDVLSDKKAKSSGMKHILESIAKKRSSVENERHQLKLELDKHRFNLEEFNEKLGHLSSQLNKETAKKVDEEKNRQVLSQSLDAHNQKLNKLNSEMQFKKSRHMLLSDMEKSYEGYQRSVKGVLAAFSKDGGNAANNGGNGGKARHSGIHGAVAQLIEVEQRYEMAIEAALGPALQNIVTSTEEDAREAIEYLKSNKLGRATFLPMTAVNGRKLEDNSRAIANSAGFCGIASDLVRFDSKYNGILQNLLGRVVIVEDLNAGIAIARKFNYGFRIVTLEGDILNTSGAMSGGSHEQRGPGILSRHREITELTEAMDMLQKEIGKVTGEISDMNNQLTELDKKIAEISERIKTIEMDRFKTENIISQENVFIQSVTGRIDMLKIEIDGLEKQKQEQLDELEQENQAIRDIENSIEATRVIISQNQERFRDDQGRRDNLNQDIMDLKISVNSFIESLNSIKEALERIDADIHAGQKGIERKAAERDRNVSEAAIAQKKIVELEQEMLGLDKQKKDAWAKQESFVGEKHAAEERMEEVEKQLAEMAERISSIKEELIRSEVKKSKLELEVETLQNRMWDEYEVTYSRALELKKDYGTLPQAGKRINELKAEIKTLGVVNVAAIEEYVKTKERYEFLSNQLLDLEKTEEKLKRVIAEVTAIMKKQFVEQFAIINNNFSIVFKELFGGGRAELKIEDNDNILESGIEIEVQPPGKKLQNMMLLSGGERALTAMALLFGILRMKPSPFCILDEIEAALDDANVARFAQYLKNLSKSTQFIMITHRKGTMEVADILYGVTMQEHGISRLVSIRLDDSQGKEKEERAG